MTADPQQTDRRSFLGNAALASLPMWDSSFAYAEASPNSPAPGLIIREKEPENLEFPFLTLDGFATPSELFYVRNHFAAPAMDVKKWKLKVEGAVDHPLEMALDDLLKMTAVTQSTTLECVGNGRVLLTPKVRGVAWELGAVGTANWTGVPLHVLLEKAGVKKSAVEVVLVGADSGEVKDEPKSPGVIHFARSLPMAKALKPEVLLAHSMNGQELPPAHGYPLRAIVAGWYGVASVKWLERIVVVDKPFVGYYQSMDYTIFENIEGLPSLVTITEMQVKSQIARPAFHEVVPANSTYRVYGSAWAGEAAIDKVEISTDAGKSWSAARLLDKKPQPFEWCLWEYDWRTPDQAGKASMMSRATDSKGRTQPLERDAKRRNYMVNHVVPVEVVLR